MLSCLLFAGCVSSPDINDDVMVVNEPDYREVYKDMAREMSNGSVEIYDVDGPAAPDAPAPVLAQDFPALAPAPVSGEVVRGVPSLNDPHVTVYPFDGSPIQQRQDLPPLAPPSERYRPLESPFGGPLQTPAAPQLKPPGEPVSSLHFRHGSSSLSDSDRRILNTIARQGGPVVVSGHSSERTETSDPVESSIVNLKMSMDRAFSVSRQLIKDGVPPDAIDTRAYGATRPVSLTGALDEESANRRVEIYSEGGVPSVPDAAIEAAPIPPLARY